MSPELHALVVEGRRRQGLPVHVEDRPALAKVVSILLPVEELAEVAATLGAGRDETRPSAGPPPALDASPPEPPEQAVDTALDLSERPVEDAPRTSVTPVRANGISRRRQRASAASAGGGGHAASG
jgi:hypothetical protein